MNVDRCSVKQTNNGNTITIYYTPTIPHCSMAQIIGLMIRVKVQTFLPKGVKVWVGIT